VKQGEVPPIAGVHGSASRAESPCHDRLIALGIPVLGAATLIVPFVELFKPGQPAPYSEFPYIGLAILAAATVIAWITERRHPATGAGEGTTFAEP
jgi:hypothetical protein